MRNIIQDMNSEQVLSGITFKWLIQFDFVTSSLGLLPISSFRIVVEPMAHRPLEPGMVDGTLSGRNFAKFDRSKMVLMKSLRVFLVNVFAGVN